MEFVSLRDVVDATILLITSVIYYYLGRTSKPPRDK